VRILVDENVSLALSPHLRALGHEVEHISELASKGMTDEEIWKVSQVGPRLLITRDFHFTNRYRFDPSKVLAILYIRIGNLSVEDEIELVDDFLRNYRLEEFKGRLVTLSTEEIKIR